MLDWDDQGELFDEEGVNFCLWNDQSIFAHTS